MSTFSKLKQRRKEKENKSFTSIIREEQNDAFQSSTTSSIGVDQAPVELQPSSTIHASYAPEGLYEPLTQDLEIRVHVDESGKGRGIYNLRQRKPGDVLLLVKPHVAALSNGRLEGHCSSCFGAGTALRRCTGCKVLYYCDHACQKADWALHKHECTAIQRWTTSDSDSPIVPSDAIRCLGRILWNKSKLGKDDVWVREMDGMQSHRTSLSKDPGSQDPQIYSQLSHAVVRYLALNSPQEMAKYGVDSVADLLDLVSRFMTNTFTVSNPALEPLGACVSPLIALLNHSCDPNAVVVFPRVGTKDQEPQMQVIALKDIAPDEEILTSYIDATLPRAIRQKQLRESFYFTCCCSLCSPRPNAPVDLREALSCPNACGGVCVLPSEADPLTRCSKCKSAVKDTDAILDAIRIGQDALDKAEGLQNSNPQKSIQLTTKLIPILTGAGLVPAAHPLLALCRLNASLLITKLSSDASVEEIVSPSLQSAAADVQDGLDEAIRAATRSYNGLSQILPEGHPARGVALAELGKLLCVDEPLRKDSEVRNMPKTLTPPLGSSTSVSAETTASYPPSGPARLKLACGILVRALTELKIGFGGGKSEGGEVGRNTRKLAVAVEKELSVWQEGVKNVLQDARVSTRAV